MPLQQQVLLLTCLNQSRLWERFALVAQSAYFRTLVSSDSEHVRAPSGTGCSRIFSMPSDVFSPHTGTPFPYRKFRRKGMVSPWWQMPLCGYLNLLATWSPKPGVASSIKAIVSSNSHFLAEPKVNKEEVLVSHSLLTVGSINKGSVMNFVFLSLVPWRHWRLVKPIS